MLRAAGGLVRSHGTFGSSEILFDKNLDLEQFYDDECGDDGGSRLIVDSTEAELNNCTDLVVAPEVAMADVRVASGLPTAPNNVIISSSSNGGGKTVNGHVTPQSVATSAATSGVSAGGSRATVADRQQHQQQRRRSGPTARQSTNAAQQQQQQSAAPIISDDARRRQQIRQQQRQRSRCAETQRIIDRLEASAERDLRSSVCASRTCRNVTFFVLLYASALCLRSSVSSYIDGVMDELRRKYFFASNQLRLIDGLQLVGVVVSLGLLALFGRRSNKPVVIFVGMVICAVGTIVCAVPYFVESVRGGKPFYDNATIPVPLSRYSNMTSTTTPPPTTTTTTTTQFSSSTAFSSPLQTTPVPDLVAYMTTELCPNASASTEPCHVLNSTVSATYSFMAYSVISFGSLTFGAGSGLFITSGFVYIEESGLNKAAAAYFGVLLSMSSFGQFIGACISWWFTSYRLNLSSPDNSSGSVADWEYRSWWLGLVVFSAMLLLIAWPFLFFPRWIVEPEWMTAARERHVRQLNRLLEWQKQDRRRRRDLRKKADQWHNNRTRTAVAAAANTAAGCTANEHVAVPTDVIRQIETGSSVDGQGARHTVESNSAISSTVTDHRASNGSDAYLLSAQEFTGTEETSLENFYSSDLPPSQGSSNGGGQPESDNDELEVDGGFQNDLPAAAAGDDEDPRVAGSYSNPLCSTADEQYVAAPAAAAAAGGSEDGSRPGGRGVTFNEQGVERRSNEPQIVIQTVRTNKRRRTAIEKKVNDVWRLISEFPLYSLTVVAASLAAYLPAGYRINASHFVQAQYGYDSEHAWFYTIGLCYSLSQAVGAMLGGIVVHKMRLSHSQLLKLIISVLAVTMATFLLLFAVDCPDAGYQWQHTTLSNVDDSSHAWVQSCNPKCSCGIDGVAIQTEPICFSNGQRFYSPCHAGCQKLRVTNTSLNFYDCSCGNATSTTNLMTSVECTPNCPVYGAYWIILFVAIVAHSMAQVSIVLLFLRMVAEKRRSLSLGFGVWIIVVAAFVPGEAVYRAFQSTSCADGMKQKDCHNEDVCWRYDLDHYRYLIHGATVAFLAASIALFSVVFCLTPSTSGAWIPVDGVNSRTRSQSQQGNSGVQTAAAAAASNADTAWTVSGDAGGAAREPGVTAGRHVVESETRQLPVVRTSAGNVGLITNGAAHNNSTQMSGPVTRNGLIYDTYM